MADETILAPPPIEPIRLKDALEERYLAYALSTIMHRALPDVRDGLKPVHRRLLFAMRQLKLDPAGGFKKCARVVGDVIGKYHPHGDQSVYDALVRLAQSFSQRYPLVDGQGNFGNIDGDNAAAMRYTEARMTAIAAALLDGIDEDTVDFRETYDGEEEEPVVLPAAFPNLLANGSSGIAVGMATSIPPHNADEVCDAALYLIKHPKASVETLLTYLPGPDFPTGGVLVDDTAGLVEAYRTGRGSFRLRARWHTEDTGRGGYQIIVTEIPYGVQKSRLIEKMADLLQAKKLPLLGDIDDESAEDIRIVIEPKSRNVDAALLMEQLFRLTELEARIPLNMTVLSKGQVPQVLGLAQVLQEWLDHRRVVLRRRSEHRLREIDHRLEVLGGLLIAYLNLDEVIRIIRNEDEPKPALIARFALTDVQAEAILNMRLRSLRKLEEIEIRAENDRLTTEREGLVELLGSDEMQWDRISAEIKGIKKQFGKATPLGKRKTVTAALPDIDVAVEEALIDKEPVTVVLSEKGWIRALKGHDGDLAKLTFKTDDVLKVAIKAQTTDKIVLFATNGKFYTLEASELPGGRGQGEPVRLMIDLDEADELLETFVHKPGRKLVVASSVGNGFVVTEDEVVAQTRKGKQVLNLGDGERALLCRPAEGDAVAVVGENRRLLVFPLAELNELTRGRGVRLQKYKDGGLADVQVFTAATGLKLSDTSGRVRTVTELDEFKGARAAAGSAVPKGWPKSGRFGLTGFETA
ncbi:DNA topoisomerase IV, A subunit [Rhodomicrobium vannielii ATCC 17100]|uniref:DNA topoisomerase 4 subunit A n=1 Tax=Rhodomicrobium vannielii (strain ATCC 17100 / DSM 162 / LMG 4299 / NCIMB 10020 / ATH 3.1.1) TaxID=648757 RepID=E3I6K3_RHOVT|nr:DNA topoisomerase IV subunit A [Rhodomicrobium vannielii]ADP70650.1 DNA topoisomerase IV, A subunit [Rhodomicrobium vannielii ATCC 17100]